MVLKMLNEWVASGVFTREQAEAAIARTYN
jgi:hypothetical protein